MSPRVFRGEEPLAEAAAERIVEVSARALAARDRFAIGLSGGRTPRLLHRILASDGWRGRLDWTRAGVWFADERAVPPDDPDSNYAMVKETLIDPLGLDPLQVHRMKGEYPDLELAVEEYEVHLREPLDVLVLGVGEDGHYASVFPGSPLVMERIRRVAAVLDAAKPPPRRLTITPRVVREAGCVLVLANGESKVSAVARALEGDADIREVPARMLREYEWFVDRAAAAGLVAATPGATPAAESPPPAPPAPEPPSDAV